MSDRSNATLKLRPSKLGERSILRSLLKNKTHAVLQNQARRKTRIERRRLRELWKPFSSRPDILRHALRPRRGTSYISYPNRRDTDRCGQLSARSGRWSLSCRLL